MSQGQNQGHMILLYYTIQLLYNNGLSKQVARPMVTDPERQTVVQTSSGAPWGWVSSFLTAHQHILGYSVPFI